MLCHDPCSRKHKKSRVIWLQVSEQTQNKLGLILVLILRFGLTVCRLNAQWQCMDVARSHLSCVVHLHLCDLPVAGLCVVFQPGLAGKEATNSKQPHTCQQGKEATLPADVLPGQHGQHLPRERPPHRLIIQGEFLGLPRPGLQLSIRPDLSSHICYEAKSLFLHHD